MPRLRAGLRARVGCEPRHRVRQGRHRERARPRCGVPDPLHSHPHDLPCGDSGLLPARSARQPPSWISSSSLSGHWTWTPFAPRSPARTRKRRSCDENRDRRRGRRRNELRGTRPSPGRIGRDHRARAGRSRLVRELRTAVLRRRRDHRPEQASRTDTRVAARSAGARCPTRQRGDRGRRGCPDRHRPFGGRSRADRLRRARAVAGRLRVRSADPGRGLAQGAHPANRRGCDRPAREGHRRRSPRGRPRCGIHRHRSRRSSGGAGSRRLGRRAGTAAAAAGRAGAGLAGLRGTARPRNRSACRCRRDVDPSRTGCRHRRARRRHGAPGRPDRHVRRACAPTPRSSRRPGSPASAAR